MTFSDSTSFVVNSFDDSPSPASTQIDLIRNAFISYALTNLKQNIKIFTIFHYGKLRQFVRTKKHNSPLLEKRKNEK